MTSIETHCLASVASSKCSHFVKLLMFLFVQAKLLPLRHNLYGNSLDIKLKYMREKNTNNLLVQLLSPNNAKEELNRKLGNEIKGYE